MELSKLFASWHPALVHFPIALLFLAIALESFAFVRKDERAAWAGQVALMAGTLGLMFSFITGNYAEINAARHQIPQRPIGDHEAYATAVSWLFIGLVVFRSYIHLGKRQMFAAYLLLSLMGVALLGVTGLKGGKLVFHYAAGVENVKPPEAPTPQDLANLTLKGEENELQYSDMMHHIFGWMVLSLSLWLAYQFCELPYQDKVKALGPIVLTAGGLFLMICSDFDSWPLSDKLPITDPEVLFHKVLATIMIFFGIGMSLARKRQGGEASSMQSHLVAVLALVGGGMLFTHVHTGAPFSDVAVGVYVQHFVIGCLALICGGIKMMELIAPERRRLWNLTWIFLLLVVSVTLITYREGFPWYVPQDKLW